MYRCSTVTKAEVEQLQRVNNIVRKGRVRAINAELIDLEEGTEPTNAQTLHVDCTADGLARRPEVPVFGNERITLQSVRTCQQVFSAAFISHVEFAYSDQGHKNELCTPVPHPDSDLDFLRTALANATNGGRWSQDAELSQWLRDSRLDGFTSSDVQPPELSAAAAAEQAKVLGELAAASAANLQRLLAE